MKTLAKYEYRMPAFLLSAIVNGDTSGLSDDDFKVLDRVYNEENQVLSEFPANAHAMWSVGEEEYFTWRPDFLKKGCTVVDVTLFILI